MELRRPDPESDFDEVLALVQECDRAVYGGCDWTADELREEWDGLDLATDAWLADVDGRLAGVVHLCEIRGTTFIADGYVHPDRRGRGVGAALLDAVEARARERLGEVTASGRVVLHSSHLVGDKTAPRLHAAKGYTRVRSFFRMVVELVPPLHAPEWPGGVETRPFSVDDHGRLLHAADASAFAEEWGWRPEPYDTWAERAFGKARFNPSLVVVAWGGHEIAGFALNYPKRMGDWGWIRALGVTPAWRRQGLGLALLRESFRRFAEAGETTVALGVDSQNPTGATRLYERAGMRELWRADVWEKEIAPGA